MFETIFIGTSGLLAHAKGLRIVGNNLANVNTPGFKSAQLQFADLFEQGNGQHPTGSGLSASLGAGVTSLGSKINFNAGIDQGTGNPLDLNINGNGFYAIRRGDAVLYTRSGDFRFDDQGFLVNTAGDHVLALDSDGKLVNVTVSDFARSMPKATATVALRGNLTSTVATPPVNATVNNISVFDANGVNYPVSLSFKNNGAGDYTVSINSAAGAVLATAPLKFAAGFPVAATSKVSFLYSPAGTTPFTVTLDFSSNVTALADATTLSVASQDGYAPGVQVAQSIDPDGTVKLHYSNGQSASGARLALANFGSDMDLEQLGGGAFSMKAGATVQYGYAHTDSFGTLVAGHREGSNVDLAEEFSNLILMQRGYQASSHVISTANDMIQELFDMKGHR